MEEWQAQGWRQVGKEEEAEAMEKEMREQKGLEAGNPPVVPLVEVVVTGETVEGGGNGKERRMRQETEERKVVQGFLALVESQEAELKNKKKEIKGSQSFN